MFCRFCGEQIKNDSIYCSNCGRRLASDSKNQNSSHDLEKSNSIPKHEKDEEAFYYGIALLVISLIFGYITASHDISYIEEYQKLRAVMAIFSLVIRIVVTIWVVKISERLNRDTLVWGIFAFTLPSFALISISNKSKKQ